MAFDLVRPKDTIHLHVDKIRPRACRALDHSVLTKYYTKHGFTVVSENEKEFELKWTKDD